MNSNAYTYTCDSVQVKRKRNPEAWTRMGDAEPTMFRSYPLFEFIPGTRGDEEPKRYGDFVIDIDTKEIACSDALKIIEWFSTVYGISETSWRIYLSGKKGVHLELPSGILGTENGHVYLPQGYKRLAKDIEGELQVKLDTSLYNRGTGKPYRQPNVMRETGTCKRQIAWDDLHEIADEEDYIAACSEPGPVWEVEDTSRNQMLAELVAEYLEEARKQQREIDQRPALTEDEIDRLTINLPPCIAKFSTLDSNGNTSATFNDVAMQLTAYAVTVGMTEQQFVEQAKHFIEHYPSTSLNTLEKRYTNARARFRTMAANGNRHSCGGVLALRFSGFDCQQCTVKKGEMIIEFMAASPEEFKDKNKTLHIPEAILNPGGLINLGLRGLSMPGLPSIPQYNLPVVLTTIANAIGGRLICNGVWPNVYNIKVGPTSSGKSSSDFAMTGEVRNYCTTGFYGPTDFASGPALLRALQEQPICMLVIDEATSLFKRYENKSDSITDGKRNALLEAFSKSGQVIHKAYANSNDKIVIEKICLSLIGNATPTIYSAIKQEDFETGIMQRFDFWCYDGDVLPREGYTAQNKHLEKFAEGIKALKNSNPCGGDLTQVFNIPMDIGVTERCQKQLDEWSATVINEANQAESDGEKGIVSRKYHLAIKYGLVHAASCRPVAALSDPLSRSDLAYGIGVADMLAGWKLAILREAVCHGTFDSQCRLFLEALMAAIKAKQPPTFNSMRNRRPDLNNWRQRDIEEVVGALVARGDLIVDSSGRVIKYWVPKGNGKEL